MRDFFDFTEVGRILKVLIICSIPFVFVGFVIWVACGIEYLQCERKAQLFELEYIYGPLIGCNVGINGKWIPLANYRAVEGVKR